MKILRTKRAEMLTPQAVYATGQDFCQIFERDMNRLHRLSLLLTADPELAEKCFVRGLEDSKGGNPVFKEWAESWARRVVIVNAIRMIGPRPGIATPFDRNRAGKQIKVLPEELAAVVNLPAFERFVFVMSVLEGYAARDCRLLLNCSNFDVAEARAQALQRLGGSADVIRRAASALASQSNSKDRDMGSRNSLIAHLAASA